MENQNLLSGTSAEFIAKLEEKYSIKKAMVYRRFDYLKIKPIKGDKQVWLTDDQLSDLDKLHEHIQEHGSMDGYKNEITVTQPSGITSPETERIYSQSTATGLEPLAAIDMTAQSKAAGAMILETMLEAQYRNNPDLLSDELRQKIQQAKEMYAPKPVDPLQYAQELIQRYSSAA